MRSEFQMWGSGKEPYHLLKLVFVPSFEESEEYIYAWGVFLLSPNLQILTAYGYRSESLWIPRRVICLH